MKDRDHELDDVEKSLRSKPYIEKPDEHVTEAGNCWLNQDRVCGGDCMAYDDSAPDGPDKCRVVAGASALFPLLVLLEDRKQGLSTKQRITAVAPPNVFPQKKGP